MPGVQFDFSGQRALVSGGTSGIGFAIASALANAGAEVIAAGRLSDLATTDPAGDTTRLRFFDLDVTSTESIDQLLADIPQLDILVNCAGVIVRGGREFEIAEFERVIDVNLTGTMRLCTACRPRLQQSKGCILNTASMLTFFGSGFVPGYSASKGGVGQLTKSLAIAWAAEGIRVNAIAPGWIQTALTDPLVQDPVRSRPILDRTPMNRWGLPEDIVGAALFLLSPAAHFVTGVILPVDGGYSIA